MKRTTLGIVIAGLLAPAVWAQTTEEGPGRGVARLSLLNGDVTVRRGDSGDWVAASINAPVMAEDRVLAGPNARAEVQFDYYHRLRLAGDTEVRIGEMDVEKRRFQVMVARGTVTFTAIKGGDAQIEISTPGAAVRPVAYGHYRVTVNPDGSAEITVRSGEAEIFTPKGTQRLKPGVTMRIRGKSEQESEFQTLSEIPQDAWDQFNRNRDKELSQTKSYRYVSRDIYGAEELDGHGEWVNVAPYGMVWQPYVAQGWAPYRHGRWTWMDWYGWSWVSYDPWGWAPYHYGRWFNGGGRWCWYPGPVYGRHWWRPGVVAWFGWGGVGVGVGFGNWGWVPLAPYEPFYPWWGSRWYGGYRNRNYIQNNIRIVNNTNISNNYRNARVDGVTGTPDLSRGTPGRAIRSGELDRAALAQGALPVTPTRDSLRMADREVRSDLVSRATRENQTFYSRQQPSRVDRVPFEQQRSALEQYTGRGGAQNAGAAVSGADSGVRGGAPGSPRGEGAVAGGSSRSGSGADAGSQRGWRTVDQQTGRFEGIRGGVVSGSGETRGVAAESRGGTQTEGRSAATDTRESGTSTRQGENGWRSFGDPRQGSRTEQPSRSAEVDSQRSGWRSFGEPSRGTAATTTDGVRGGGNQSGVQSRVQSDDGWRRFGSWRGSTGGSSTSGDTGGVRGGDVSRGDSGSSSRSEARSESRSSQGSGSTGSGRSEGSRTESGSRDSGVRGGSSAPSTGGGGGTVDRGGSGRTGGSSDSGSRTSGRESAAPNTGGGSRGSSPPEGSSGTRGGDGGRGRSRGGDSIDMSSLSFGSRMQGAWSTGSGANSAPSMRSDYGTRSYSGSTASSESRSGYSAGSSGITGGASYSSGRGSFGSRSSIGTTGGSFGSYSGGSGRTGGDYGVRSGSGSFGGSSRSSSSYSMGGLSSGGGFGSRGGGFSSGSSGGSFSRGGGFGSSSGSGGFSRGGSSGGGGGSRSGGGSFGGSGRSGGGGGRSR